MSCFSLSLHKNRSHREQAALYSSSINMLTASLESTKITYEFPAENKYTHGFASHSYMWSKWNLPKVHLDVWDTTTDIRKEISGKNKWWGSSLQIIRGRLLIRLQGDITFHHAVSYSKVIPCSLLQGQKPCIFRPWYIPHLIKFDSSYRTKTQDQKKQLSWEMPIVMVVPNLAIGEALQVLHYFTWNVW